MKTEQTFLVICKDLKAQFVEQVRCLNDKLEQDSSTLAELQDFYKRRAQLEQDYSDNLNKMAQTLKRSHVQQKSKRNQWPDYTTSGLWNTLIGSTIRLSQTHSVLAEVFGKQAVQRLSDMMDDLCRLTDRAKSMTTACQEKIYSSIEKLDKKIIEYKRRQRVSMETMDAVNKEENRLTKDTQKAESQGKDPERSKKVKAARNAYCEKSRIYESARLESTRSRNEYLIELAGVNAAIKKYFTDEMPIILDLMSFGFHNSLARAAMMHLSCEESLQRCHESFVQILNKNVSDLDAFKDKKLFLDKNQSAFCLTQTFKFEPFKEDPVDFISADPPLRPCLESTLEDLRGQLEELKVHTDEQWKTLEEVDKSLMSLINLNDYDVSPQFTATPSNMNQRSSSTSSTGQENSAGIFTVNRAMHRDNRLEHEKFYLERFHRYMNDKHRYQVLNAKYFAIEQPLCEGSRLVTNMPKISTHKVGRVPRIGKPKLFGGTIDEYVGQGSTDIPKIIKSCIRVIKSYGMHHQGVFRVSGSQAEINDLKVGFEEGNDPLVGAKDARDINSTAGLLKLYFRELGEPLFPKNLFEEFVACSRIESVEDSVMRIKELTGSQLSQPVYRVMRYLFAFLNHLTDYSDENMMDPYNLAICFGPTLMPVPAQLDQVQYQANVNDVIKTIIMRHQDIFVHETPGPIYNKNNFSTGEEDADDTVTLDGDTELTDPMSFENEDLKSTSESDGTRNNRSFGVTKSLLQQQLKMRLTGSTDSVFEKQEIMRGIAHSDFTGNSTRELTFRRGDTIILYTRLNADWWEGRLAEGGRLGLVPDLYIQGQGQHRADSSQANSMLLYESTTGGSSTPEGSVATSAGTSTPPPRPPAASDREIAWTSSLEKRQCASLDDSRMTDSPTGDLPPSSLSLSSPVQSDISAASLTPGSSSIDQSCSSLATNSHNIAQSPADSLDGMDQLLPAQPNSPTTIDNTNNSSSATRGTKCDLSRSSSAGGATNVGFSSGLHVLREEESTQDGPDATTTTTTPHDTSLNKSSTSGAEADFIDNQLAEVMNGLASFEQRSSLYQKSATLDRRLELERKIHLPLAKHTPDLVLDLPANMASSSGGSSDQSTSSPPINSSSSTVLTDSTVAASADSQPQTSSPVAPPSSTNTSTTTIADTFAEESHETMRKRAPPPVVRPQIPVAQHAVPWSARIGQTAPVQAADSSIESVPDAPPPELAPSNTNGGSVEKSSKELLQNSIVAQIKATLECDTSELPTEDSTNPDSSTSSSSALSSKLPPPIAPKPKKS